MDHLLRRNDYDTEVFGKRLALDIRLGSLCPTRIKISSSDGTMLAAHDEPRHAFGGYAFWTYLTMPFLLACDGVQAEEIEPWHENGETWRRHPDGSTSGGQLIFLNFHTITVGARS